MKILTIITFALFLSWTNMNAQSITNIHIGEETRSYFTNEIDSITFDEATATEAANVTKKTYDDCYALLKEASDFTNFIYCDLNLFKDTIDILKVKTQTGKILSFNGEGYQHTYIKDGKMRNEQNVRTFGKLNTPAKYIGMKYSYIKEGDKTGDQANNFPPCILLLGQNDNPWIYIIHILFYKDKIEINTRHGEGFVDDCVLIEGNKRINPLETGKTYEASVQIVGNKLYIKKPDGEWAVFQNDFFTEDFNTACWQIWNLSKSNIHGCLQELYAGDRPGLENAYRVINKLKE